MEDKIWQKCIQVKFYVSFSVIKDTLFGMSVCRSLLIVTQTYCITLPELGKQLILKTMYKVDQTKSCSSHHIDPINIVHVAR